jgi:hypothetical protein
MRIRYKTITVSVVGEKPKICRCCGKEAKPRGLHCHHTKYEYPIDVVRASPMLATHNTVYLCYACHRVANSMRICDENYVKVALIRRLTNETECD